METLFIICILIVTFTLVASYILLKIIKVIAIALLILSILIGLSTFFLYQDVSDIQKNIMIKEKLFILKDGNNTITAFSLIDLNNMSKQNITAFGNDEIKKFDAIIKNKDYSSLKSKYYKTIIFDKSVFNKTLNNGLHYQYKNKEISFSGKDIEQILSSNTPLYVFIEKTANNQNIDITFLSNDMKEKAVKDMLKSMELNSQDEIKSYIFGMMITDTIQKNEPGFILIKIQEGKIEIYPKTAVVRLINIFPKSLILKMSQNIMSKEVNTWIIELYYWYY